MPCGEMTRAMDQLRPAKGPRTPTSKARPIAAFSSLRPVRTTPRSSRRQPAECRCRAVSPASSHTPVATTKLAVVALASAAPGRPEGRAQQGQHQRFLHEEAVDDRPRRQHCQNDPARQCPRAIGEQLPQEAVPEPRGNQRQERRPVRDQDWRMDGELGNHAEINVIADRVDGRERLRVERSACRSPNAGQGRLSATRSGCSERSSIREMRRRRPAAPSSSAWTSLMRADRLDANSLAKPCCHHVARGREAGCDGCTFWQGQSRHSNVSTRRNILCLAFNNANLNRAAASSSNPRCESQSIR